MKYSIDTSAIMEAWIRIYPIDIFPDLWSGLEDMIQNGDLGATEEVFREIDQQQDELNDWVKANKEMFIPIDDKIQDKVRTILKEFPKFINVKQNKSMADPFVVGLAQVMNATVVTMERPRFIHKNIIPTREHKVKIPDVCHHFNVSCFDIIGLCRAEGWVFKRT